MSVRRKVGMACRGGRGRRVPVMAVGVLALISLIPGRARGFVPQNAAAPPGEPSRPVRERLLGRVDGFWNAWKDGDLFRIFQLYAPSYRRKTSEAAFYELTRGMLAITPIDYEVAGIEWSDKGRRAVVTLGAHTVIQPFGSVPNRLLQLWVYEEGNWYRIMTPVQVPVQAPVQTPPVGAPPSEPSIDPLKPGLP